MGIGTINAGKSMESDRINVDIGGYRCRASARVE
jgi:hypothetical protein